MSWAAGAVGLGVLCYAFFLGKGIGGRDEARRMLAEYQRRSAPRAHDE